MLTATVDQVQNHLAELLKQLGENEELVILEHGKPVGRLLPAPLPKGVPLLGRGKGKLIHYLEDEAHLQDFAEYMP